MPMEIMIPRLGWSMEEANFVNWLKKDGEAVKSGEPLFTLESEKATQEIEAIDNGTLRIAANGPKGGEVVKVGQVIGYLLAENEATAIGAIDSTKSPVSEKAKPEVDSKFTSKDSASGNEDNSQSDAKPAISPRARRLAAELGVDTTRLRGSGPGGRVIEKDVREAADNQ